MSNSNGKTPTATADFDERFDALKHSVRDLTDLGRDKLGDLKDRAVDAKSHAFDEVGALIARAGKLIKQHPIAAVGIAFGIGYIAMRVMRR